MLCLDLRLTSGIVILYFSYPLFKSGIKRLHVVLVLFLQAFNFVCMLLAQSVNGGLLVGGKTAF